MKKIKKSVAFNIDIFCSVRNLKNSLHNPRDCAIINTRDILIIGIYAIHPCSFILRFTTEEEGPETKRR